MADIIVADEAAVRATGLKHKVRIQDPQAPLVFLIHGRAGSLDVMWAFRRCIPDHFSVIAPQAPLVDPLGGWSWWEVKEGHREELTSAVSALGLLREFMLRSIAFYNLTPPKRLAFGFSQGAGLLSLMLQRPENQFDGVAMLAGFVMRDPQPVKVRDTKILMVHGQRDETVPLDLAKKGQEHLKSIGYTVDFADDPVGHKIGPNGVRTLREWVLRV
jgi:predicted esterase